MLNMHYIMIHYSKFPAYENFQDVQFHFRFRGEVIVIFLPC